MFLHYNGFIQQFIVDFMPCSASGKSTINYTESCSTPTTPPTLSYHYTPPKSYTFRPM